MAKNLNQDNSYRIVIKCILDDEEVLLECDYAEDPSITASSSLTEHPIVTGDKVADHMYKEPYTLNFNATFSLNGNQPFVFTGEGSRLKNIEDTFLKIKNEAIFCDITKMSRGDNYNTRFNWYKNMVLTSISMVEKQNSLECNFSFKQVLTIDLDEAVYQVDVTDENLPSLTSLKQSDFTDTLLDWNSVYKVILSTLRDAGLLPDNFINYVFDYAKSATVNALGAGAIVGAGTFLIGLNVLHFIAGSLVASGPIGWIVLGVATAIGFIAGAIWSIIKQKEKKMAEDKYKIKAFKYVANNDVKNEAEAKRFCEYMGNIAKQLEVLEDYCQVYKITSNENQEIMTFIDDDYYTFKFIKNTSTLDYEVTVTDSDGQIMNIPGTIAPISNVSDCKINNPLFVTKTNNYQVYLINENGADDEANNQPEKVNEVTKDISKCMVFISQIDMKKFNEVLTELVTNAMEG